MAKRKKSQKKIKKPKLKNNILNFKFFTLVLVLLLVVSLGLTKLAKINKINQTKNSVISEKDLPTPYPTVKASPTPVPLTGFCLRVPVLTYHHIQPQAQAIHNKETSLSVDTEYFDKQMEYLVSNNYTPIFVNDLVNALISKSTLPGKPIVVTMDDGYADNYIYALPILKKYNIKANLMLSSGLVGSNSDMLTWDEIREMKASGLIYFTNHTWSHQSLTRIPQAKIETEVDTAKTQIEEHTNQSVNIFTYPYGEFNDNAISTLKSKGYLGAFTTIPGFYQCDSFIMTLHRNHIGNAPLSAYGI